MAEEGRKTQQPLADLPILQGSYRLDGRNYLQWAQLVRTTLKGRKKLSHIEGKAPGKNDPQFEAWDDEDSLIMTWLWHSMTPEISRNCMFFASGREIWDNLSQTYSMKKDIVACYDLENKIFSTKQGVLSVTDYYSVLNGLWIELDQYQNLKMKCTANSATHTEFIDRARIFKFLSGLNSEFDPIRIQILGKEKLPSLSEVFYTVRGEENRRTVMLDDPPIDGLALVSGKGPTKGSSAGKFSSKPARDDRWCTYCKKSGHTKETCFRIHGKEKVLARKGTT
ncbi:Retrotransposon gag domain [Sesbania bispinosa]|nr:Retrotransposon gag domain [Sesbania bispinosa]